jgi:hypothetical protein
VVPRRCRKLRAEVKPLENLYKSRNFLTLQGSYSHRRFKPPVLQSGCCLSAPAKRPERSFFALKFLPGGSRPSKNFVALS